MADSDGKMWKKWLEDWLKNNPGKLEKGKVHEKLWADFKGTYDALVKRLTPVGGKEVCTFCGGVTWTQENNDKTQENDMKEMCKGMAEILYFMNGIQPHSTQKPLGSGTVEQIIGEAESYRRCVIGALTAFEVYRDHCRFEHIIRDSENEMGQVKEKYKSMGATCDRCKNITTTDLIIGKAIVAGKIRKWAEEDRAKARAQENGGGAIRRIGSVMAVSEKYCKKEKQEQIQKEQFNKNLECMAKFLGLEKNNNLDPLEILTNNDDSMYTLSPDEFEAALAPATNESRDIDSAIKNLEKEVQKKIRGSNPSQPQALAQASPVAGYYPNGEGIAATLASALSVPTTAIPALAGALALPAALSAFFLYKKHKRSRNNRKKRSLRREYYGFDDDDYDVTSTEYSRTNLTAGTNSSEYSIPYTTSSSSR